MDIQDSIDVQIALGMRIRSARGQYGWTQTQLADLSGLTQTQVSRIESGTLGDPSISQVLGLARALKVPVEVLLGANAQEFNESIVRVAQEEATINTRNAGGMYEDEKELHEIRKHFKQMTTPALQSDLAEWSEERRNILIIGGKGAGKTTFLKGTLDHLFHQEDDGHGITEIMSAGGPGAVRRLMGTDWTHETERVTRVAVDDLPPTGHVIMLTRGEQVNRQLIVTMQADSLQEALDVLCREKYGIAREGEKELGLLPFDVIIELSRPAPRMSMQAVIDAHPGVLSHRYESRCLKLLYDAKCSLEEAATMLCVEGPATARDIEIQALDKLFPGLIGSMSLDEQTVLCKLYGLHGKRRQHYAAIAEEHGMTVNQIKAFQREFLNGLPDEVEKVWDEETQRANITVNRGFVYRIAQLTADARGRIATPLLYAKEDGDKLVRYSGVIESEQPTPTSAFS